MKNKFCHHCKLKDTCAKDFKCDSIEELAVKLGYENAQQMALEKNRNNPYELFTLPGFAGHYLSIERKLNC